jgi:glycosyltransferase involved in cell wall biosynthesis
MSVFNGAESLSGTLDSVLGQQGLRLELIVVNDGSRDGTASILDRYAAGDSRLRVVHQQNTGLTRALIAGAALAQAPFIARQDSGDISLPGRLERELHAMQQDDELSFVSCATEYVEPGGAFLYQAVGTGVAREPQCVLAPQEQFGLSDGPSHHGSVMFRTEAYRRCGGYRPEFYFGQDWDLWYRLAQIGKFQMLPETLYRASIGIGDISSRHKRLQDQLARLSLYALRARLAGEPEQPMLAQAALLRAAPGARPAQRSGSDANYFLGECLRRNGNHALARRYLIQAVRGRPLQLKAWIRLAQTVVGSLARHAA